MAACLNPRHGQVPKTVQARVAMVMQCPRARGAVVGRLGSPEDKPAAEARKVVQGVHEPAAADPVIARVVRKVVAVGRKMNPSVHETCRHAINNLFLRYLKSIFWLSAVS